MAFKIIEVSGNTNSTNQMSYMIDSEDDVQQLPTDIAPMSIAVTNTGELYVLGVDGVWHKWW